MSAPAVLEVKSLAFALTGWVVILTDDYDKIPPEFVKGLASWTEMIVGFGDGVYHKKIEAEMRALPPYLGRIVATQNPSVLDNLIFTSAKDARQRLLIVRDGEVQNITEDEAQTVWEAWEAGIEHVSEILIAQGLW